LYSIHGDYIRNVDRDEEENAILLRENPAEDDSEDEAGGGPRSLYTTLALTRTAKQEDWGIGLGTETDIGKLLTYAWECDGQEVHVFDKSKSVYRDDDSLDAHWKGALPQPPAVTLIGSPINSTTERSSGIIGTHESQNASSGRSFKKSASELSTEEIYDA